MMSFIFRKRYFVVFCFLYEDYKTYEYYSGETVDITVTSAKLTKHYLN